MVLHGLKMMVRWQRGQPRILNRMADRKVIQALPAIIGQTEEFVDRVESDRLERCPTAQAYYDPELKKTRFVPLCAWKFHNKRVLRKIADYYNAQ